MLSYKYAEADDNLLFHQLTKTRRGCLRAQKATEEAEWGKPSLMGHMHLFDEQAATSVIWWLSGDVQENSVAYIVNGRFPEIYNSI